MKRIPPSDAQDPYLASEHKNVVPFRITGVREHQPEMSESDKLNALFVRLTIRQRNLIFAAAETDKSTPHSVIRQIAELESAIAAVANLYAEGEGQRR